MIFCGGFLVFTAAKEFSSMVRNRTLLNNYLPYTLIIETFDYN